MDLGKVSSPLLPLQTKLTHPTMRINTHTHTNKNKKVTKLNHENEHTHTQKDTKRSPTNLNQEIITQNNQYNQFWATDVVSLPPWIEAYKRTMVSKQPSSFILHERSRTNKIF